MISLNKYDFDCELLFKQLNPSSFRINDEGEEKEDYNLLLAGLGSVFNSAKNAFLSEMTIIKRDLSYNWSKGQMERLLNDNFDPVLRRITITNNFVVAQQSHVMYLDLEIDPSPEIFYTDAETDPNPKYFYTDSEGSGSFNFTINLNGVSAESSLLEALVNKYKKVSKTYNYV